jgi:hypothetical protein
LFTIFIGPFIAYDILWMINVNQTHSLVSPAEIWETTFVFALFPLLVLLVLFATPERLDPVIPWRSKILLGIKPFFRIIPPAKFAS